MSPGPIVAATASMRRSSTPASTTARATTGMMSSTWARLAISGTTPPNWACRSIWLDTTDDRTSVPPITTAAAVSSQLVSIPSTTVSASGRFTATPPDVVSPATGASSAARRARCSSDPMSWHHITMASSTFS